MERLQKVMASAGVGSRRRCEDLIREGRVLVNGEPAHLGMSVEPGVDRVVVDGKPLGLRALRTKVYLMLNKPRGFVSTVSDPQGRPTVMDLVRSVETRIYPVGRLDLDTQGLLLLTNDGEFSHALTHPRHEVEKVYLAVVEGEPSDQALATLAAGVLLEDGLTAPARVQRMRDGKIRVALREGKKRQVRRMFEAVEHPVVELRRVRVGPLDLGRLPEGSFRRLTRREVEALRKVAEKGLQGRDRTSGP